MPSIWYQMGLHCRTVSDACPYDVAGYTFSGVPGVVIGHNQTIGWGFTNLGPDVTDLYLEKVVGDTYVVGGTTQADHQAHRGHQGRGPAPTSRVDGARDRARPAASPTPPRTSRTVGATRPERRRSRRRAATGTPSPCSWTALHARSHDGRRHRAQHRADLRGVPRGRRRCSRCRRRTSSSPRPTARIGYQTPGRIPIRAGLRRQVPGARLGPGAGLDRLHPVRRAALRRRTRDDGWVVTANQASIYQELPVLPHRRLVVRRAQPAHRRPRHARDHRRQRR